MRVNRGISRTAETIIVLIILIVGVVGVYFALSGASIATSSTSSSSSSTSTLSSSTSTSSTSASSGLRDTLIIDDVYYPIDGLNPLYETLTLPYPNWQEYTVWQALVDVNLTADFHTGAVQLVPGLASNWTASPDYTTYTFNLRHGVKFSNGDPFNAYQVWTEMYGFYYLSGNSSTWLQGELNLFDMSHANFGPATLNMIAQSRLANPSHQAITAMTNSSWPIYVTGPYQIVFHLRAPFAYFPGTVVTAMGNIFDVQYVLDHGGYGTPANVNNYFNTNPIPGTGPYMVTNLVPNSYVKYTQNPTYWGLNLTASQIAAEPWFDPGHAKNVIVYGKSDDVARYIDLSTGAAQISMIEATNWNLVLAHPNEFSYLLLPQGEPLFTGMALNTHLYPTNITAVRQAIVHAINYTDLELISKSLF